MRFLSDILAKAGLIVDGAAVFNSSATGQTPATNDNSTKFATTAWVRSFVQPYTLPIASATVLGGIKVGTGLAIDSLTGVLSVSGGSVSLKSTQTFTATEGQSIFTIANGYTAGLIDVFLNGVYLSPGQTTATNGSTVTLADPAIAGDIIDVIITSPIGEGSVATTDNLPEGTVNLYYTPTRVRTAISLTTTGVSGAATYDNVTGLFNIPNYQGLVPSGGNSGQLLAKIDGSDYSVQWIDEAPAASYTSQIKHQVKAAQAINKGQAVYVSSSNGTNMLVSKASNASEGTSSKTMGLLEANASVNGFVNVIAEGLLSGLNTGTANAGDPVWLGTNGDLIYGLANKPVAPAHLVFIGVVTRANTNNGEIFVKVQNGFELDELHDLSVKNASDGDMIKYVASTGLWTKIAASTSNIVEGTNLYYTNARVASYLTANSYATQGYVNTAISNLVASAPTTLDTLNELATALGNDPNFATTIATSIGTKVPQARTITINGTAYDLSADRVWSIAAGVTSFNTRTGAITLTSGDVTGALGYTPYNSTNPSGYITSYTETDTLATVTGRGASTSTAITLNAELTIQTNTNTGIRINSTTGTQGLWIRTGYDSDGTATPAVSATNVVFQSSGSSSGTFSFVSGNSKVLSIGGTINSLVALQQNGNQVLHAGNYSSYALPLSGGVVTGLTALTGKVTLGNRTSAAFNGNVAGLTINNTVEIRSTGSENPPGLTWHYEGLATRHILMTSAGVINVVSPSTENSGVAVLAVNGNTVLHTANYNSYSPTLTGGGASGTWGINITGSASSAFGIGYDGNAISGMGPITNWDSRPGVGYAGFGINWHTGVTISGYAGYGGVRLYASGYPTHSGSVLRLEASGAVYTYGGLYSDGNAVIHAGNIGSQSVSYAATAGSANNIDGTSFVNTSAGGGQNADTIESNGISYVSANVNLLGQTDGALYSQAYNVNWQHQIYGDYRTGQLVVRGKNSGSWTSWRTILDSSNASYAWNMNQNLRTSDSPSFNYTYLNGGSGISIGDSSFSQTYNDSTRSRFYASSSYPVLTLNSTIETGNPNHGPTIQFAVNGYDSSRQWVIGTGGTGQFLDFGTSQQSNKNPHGGIAGYKEGTGGTYMRITKGGDVGIGYNWGDGNYGGTGNPGARFHLIDNAGITYHGRAGIFRSTPSAGGNFTPFLFQSDYGNHSYGIVARFYIAQAGADRPSIQFAYGGSNNRWAVGYCYPDDNFRITQNHAYDNNNNDGGWGSERFRINTDGATYCFSSFTASGDVTAYSDIRVKKEVKLIDNALEKIKAIRGVTFSRTDADNTDKRHAGVIAQEVLEVLPEVVSETDKGLYTVAYGNMAGLFIEAIKEQQTQIESQQSEITELKDLVKQLLAK